MLEVPKISNCAIRLIRKRIFGADGILVQKVKHQRR